MLKYNEEKCRAELEEMGVVVTSFDISKKEENKIIADMSYKDENDATRTAYFKIYNTKKFEQIERVYTILQLLKTKLEAEAKKNNESFVNLLPEVYKIWKKGDFFYILEEKIEGASLADWAREKEIKTFDEFAKITKQICDAVAMIHQPFPPIVHCDIKETNIIIDKNDEVAKIIDFDAAFIEGSSAYNIVRSTKGYRPTEMVNDAPVSQSDIYAIGCIIEKLINDSDWKNKLDSQCNEKLNQIIIKSKDDVTRRYYDVNELKAALSEVEIIYMLQHQMNELDDLEGFNVFSYDNDCDGKIEHMREMIMEYTDADILYVADREEQQLAFTMKSMYCKGDVKEDGKAKSKNTEVLAIPYDELVACVKSANAVGENKDALVCITKSSAGQWKRHNIYLPSNSTELVMGVLNNIVLYKNSYYSQERIADYYSNKCHEANDILIRKELEGKQRELNTWWDFVIDLGTLACDKEDDCGKATYSCSNILLKVYKNKRKALKHKGADPAEIIECYNNEIRLGSETAEKKLEAYKKEIEIKQIEMAEKDKTPKIFGDIVNRFAGKKEEE